MRMVKYTGVALSTILLISTAAFAEPCPPEEPPPKNIVDPAACQTPLTLTGPSAWAPNTTWTASGGVGPYSFRAGFPLVSGTGTSTTSANCISGQQTITATDRCGKSASMQVQMIDETPLTLSGPDTWAANTTWAATGGVGPYEFTAGFPLVSGTGTSTSTAPSCGTQKITVTDRCGKSANKQVQMVGGSWIEDNAFVYNANAEIQACVSSYFGYLSPYDRWKSGYIWYAPISTEQIDDTHIKYTFQVIEPNTIVVGFTGNGAFAYGQPNPGVSSCYGQPAKNIWCRGDYVRQTYGYKNNGQNGVWIYYDYYNNPFWAENWTLVEDYGTYGYGHYDIYTLDGVCAAYATEQTGYQHLKCSK